MKRWDFTPSTLQARVSLGWSILGLPSPSSGDCGQGQADDRAEYAPIRCLTSEAALALFPLDGGFLIDLESIHVLISFTLHLS